MTDRQRKYFIVGFIIANLLLSLLAIYLYTQRMQDNTIINRPDPKFVVSSWEFPDENGQGIEGIDFFENSSGSWQDSGISILPSGDMSFDWNASVGMKLRCYFWLDPDFVGATSLENGKNFFRFTATVHNVIGDLVYSKQNFTYVSSEEVFTLYLYTYEQVLNFLPQSSASPYNLTLSYDIWYVAEGSTNATLYFEGADEYPTFTFSKTGGTQGISGGVYQITTSTTGYTQYFGIDQFSSQASIYTSVIFRPTTVSGGYRFQPIIYFYQKTDLDVGSHWALSLFWYPSGLYLYNNSANGDTPDAEQLTATVPIVNHQYRMILANYGTETLVDVYDLTADGSIYSGNTTTISYDAQSLYAAFGQYASGSTGAVGTYDNFTLYGFSFPPDWVSTYLPLIFIVPLLPIEQTFAGGSLLILLGMVMVVAAPMYLVKGGKDELSNDKFFYFCVAFIFGWSLIIAVIMP